MLTEEDIHHMPVAVQRYLRYVEVVGKPKVWNYRVTMSGEMRNGEKQPWMNVGASQISFANPAARLFFIKGSLRGIPMIGYHRYVGDEATFKIKVASLFTPVDASGYEMTRSETVTVLNDMCLLAPATLISRAITWSEIHSDKVRVTLENAGHTVSAVLDFDEPGRLVNFTSDDRSMTTDGETYEHRRWSTPVDSWCTECDEILPHRARAVWQAEDGSEFEYARLVVDDVEYNVAEL